MSRRSPQIPFDAERIRPFLGHRGITSCSLLTEGGCNSNYRIRVGAETFVARFYSRGSPTHDRYILNLVKDSLPVPEILHAGDTWAIMQFLPGTQLRNSPADIHAAAHTLARIGRITFPHPGRILPGGNIQPFDFGGVAGFVQTWLAKPEVREWLDTKTISALQRLLETEAPRLAELDGESRLVHGDFNPTNILIADGKVTGILDWEFAHSGSPNADLGNLLRHLGPRAIEPIARAFDAEGAPLSANWPQRAALVDLTAQLEFLTSGHTHAFKQRCVHRIQQLLTR
ncbi:MAG: phosphotransferase [bacterium]|nr:phosphotransferase [bacterium]